ncbi:MAG: cell division protein FtsB [Roseivirga sp.]|jgi:cell division protein FtsB
MGLFWDLVQQSQIEDQKKEAESLEERVNNLETELEKTKNLLVKTLRVLEESTNMDIDGDGQVG